MKKSTVLALQNEKKGRLDRQICKAGYTNATNFTSVGNIIISLDFWTVMFLTFGQRRLTFDL